MERTLTGPAVEAGMASDGVPIATGVPSALRDYLVRLGIRDEALLHSLARESLAQARKLAGTSATDQLALRAIEAVQRRFDRVVAKNLGLDPIRDAAKVAGLRAALLMCPNGVSADVLFDSSDVTDKAEQLARLASCLPLATPPEAPLPMPVQPFRFVFFKSS